MKIKNGLLVKINFLKIKNESYIEMKIKNNYIEKKYLNKKLDYIANKLEIILFNQFIDFLKILITY